MDVAGRPLARSGVAGLDGAGAGGEAPDDTCFFPQIDALDALDAEFPKATLVLNRRASPEAWLQSVDDWNDLCASVCATATWGPACRRAARWVRRETRSSSRSWKGTKRTRAFVAAHPSHTLVEVTIEDPDAGRALEAAFGIPAECWRRENANELGSWEGNAAAAPAETEWGDGEGARVLTDARDPDVSSRQSHA